MPPDRADLGQPGCQRRTVPETPGREKNLVDPRTRWMSTQASAILVEETQVVLLQLAQGPERHIIGAGRVALREYKLIVLLEHLMVQDQHQIEA